MLENLPSFLDYKSPLLWAMAAVIIVALWIKRKNVLGAGDEKRQEDQTRVFVFNEKAYSEKLGDTFSGNVAYGTGAFMKRETCAMRFFYGRPHRDPKMLSSRKQTTIYQTRFGDASPLDPHRPDWKPDDIDINAFNDYRGIAVEREYSRGRMVASSTNGQQKLMFAVSIASIAMGGLAWLLVLILPLTPLVEKLG